MVNRSSCCRARVMWIEPDDGIAAIGSGAPYATAAAKALLAHTDLQAREIVESAMGIAAELCIFTNDRFTIDSVEGLAGYRPRAMPGQIRTPQQRWTTRIERNGRGTTTHCASPTQRTSVPTPPATCRLWKISRRLRSLPSWTASS